MFTLNIECSKDIDELHINFTDGSSSMVTKPKKKAEPREPKPKESPSKASETPKEISIGYGGGDLLDLDADFGHVGSEVVQKPNVDIGDRPVSVAPELQNLDI